MILNQSKQTADITELTVQYHLTTLGWMVTKAPEGYSYDFIVDRGYCDGKRILETIQVKTDPRTSSRPSPNTKSEQVSSGGKERNSYWYYDEGVDYIATVKDGRPVYWERKVYQKKTPGELNKSPTYQFPRNDKMVSYRKSQTEIPIVATGTLDNFLE